MDDFFAVLIVMTVFFSIGFIIVFFIYTRNRERTSIIEKGMSGEDLKSFLSPPKRRSNYPQLAKWAIAALGIGIALIIGAFLDREIQEMVTFGLVFLLPGLGWLILHFITSKNNSETV